MIRSRGGGHSSENDDSSADEPDSGESEDQVPLDDGQVPPDEESSEDEYRVPREEEGEQRPQAHQEGPFLRTRVQAALSCVLPSRFDEEVLQGLAQHVGHGPISGPGDPRAQLLDSICPHWTAERIEELVVALMPPHG